MTCVQRNIVHNPTLQNTDTFVMDCGNDKVFSEIENLRLMKSEKRRLETYWNWPSASCQRPQALARAGLFYTGESDRVQCAFCRGVLKNWESYDEPMLAHKVHFPRCLFVLGEDVGNIPKERPLPSEYPLEPTQQVTKKPGDMTVENNRLNSFFAWPSGLSQTPDSLARAGFYHVGDSQKPDRVKCAYCQGRLYDWQPRDDPWVEHARCFPRCPYIKLCLGQNFVHDIQVQEQVVASKSKQTSPEVLARSNEPSTESRNVVTQSITEQQTSINETVRNEVEEAMKSHQVQAVLEMGYSRDLVRCVVESKIRETGTGFTSSIDLASVLLERENQTATASARTASNSEAGGSETNQVRTSVSKMEHSEMSELQERYLCKVCMENQIQVTFVPCGHLVCCGQCGLVMEQCPICRTSISGMVKTYY
ncbi:E3 ubiquitin-protein ligase XIAP-like [Gigantopelta aegis]|uniref:E3 ubiquitin-protein ligase XIAP-like n=1 Tax=Gigantopelta aegis TaxID=1735272 RepID=UPI001B88ADB0|nr:E3 ubiquitin-protein ligase XIAP-like [Gigantopelta aegis]